MLRMSSCESELGSEMDAPVCRLTDMAPEVVCMLTTWTGVEDTLELRATCWTLKAVVDEVTPRAVAREEGSRRTEARREARRRRKRRRRKRRWRLAATEAGVMERTVRCTGAAEEMQWKTTKVAVEMGEVEVLRRLRGLGWVYDMLACKCAASAGRVDALEYLLDGREVSETHEQRVMCWCAAERGELGALRWLRARGYAWDEYTCVFAKFGGHEHVLAWAHEGARATWPCAPGVCSWGDGVAEERRADRHMRCDV